MAYSDWFSSLNVCEERSCNSMYQYFLLFYGWIVFHSMGRPHFVYPFISGEMDNLTIGLVSFWLLWIMLWMAVLLCGLFNLSLSPWCFSSLQNEDNNFIVTESWRASGRESTLQPWNTMPQQGPLFQVGFLNLPESDDLMPLNHTLKHSLNGTFWACSTTI